MRREDAWDELPMVDINPFNVISRGLKLNPVITKILIAVPVLLACVALGTKLITDPATAIFGGILAILAAVVLFVVASTGRKRLGGVGVWFARFCLVAFCATTTTLFTSWGWDWPKPTGCLIHPDKQCVTDLPKPEPTKRRVSDDSYELLRDYLYPSTKSGVVDRARVDQVRAILKDRGVDASITFVLSAAAYEDLRQDLVRNLGLKK